MGASTCHYVASLAGVRAVLSLPRLPRPAGEKQAVVAIILTARSVEWYDTSYGMRVGQSLIADINGLTVATGVNIAIIGGSPGGGDAPTVLHARGAVGLPSRHLTVNGGGSLSVANVEFVGGRVQSGSGSTPQDQVSKKDRWRGGGTREKRGRESQR